MAAEDDDFSFPAVPPPHFMDSPPLWRRPHRNPEFDLRSFQELGTCRAATTDQGFEGTFELCFVQELKLKSSATTQSRRSYSYGDYEDERMDVLWEDLNEECSSRNRVLKTAEACDDRNSSPGRAVQVSCIEAWKLSRSSGHRKKPKILVFIKIMKKVLAHRNSRRSIKKRSAW